MEGIDFLRSDTRTLIAALMLVLVLALIAIKLSK